MSTGAIVMMLLAMIILWGGLIVAAINLSRSEESMDDVPIRDL
ncbi:methionine/alanine import family NSS transporter small subunit [Nocardioides pacificus]